jgi:hypothetical protein
LHEIEEGLALGKSILLGVKTTYFLEEQFKIEL